MRSTNDFHVEGIQGGGVIAHPVFVWCVEWPMLWLRSSELYGERMKLLPNERMGGGAVHYGEDIIIHRPIAADDRIHTKMTLIQMSQRRQGTTTTYKFEHKVAGQTVVESWNTAYWRGVALDSDSDGNSNTEALTLHAEMPPPPPPSFSPPLATSTASTYPPEVLHQVSLKIAALEGVVYSECSRIWNPIHSDKATALASGLSDTILHGTATLAKCVTELVKLYMDNRPWKVRRIIVGRFGAAITMPSTPVLRVLKISPWLNNTMAVHFELINDEGMSAIQGGIIVYDHIEEGDNMNYKSML